MLNFATNNETVKAVGPIPFLTDNFIYRRYDVMAKPKVSKPVKICKVEGCERKHSSKGYCANHYQHVKRTTGFKYQETCSVDRCESPMYAKGLCSRHYTQMMRNGKLFGNPKTRAPGKNDIITEGLISKIIIRDKDNYRIAEAIIDTSDLPKVKNKRWHLTTGNYVLDSHGIMLHRYILSASKNDGDVDHADRNPLNCRKSNLRFATKTQNMGNMKIPSHNSSGYKGVSYFKQTKRWEAYISKKNKKVHLGFFKSKVDAAKSYNEAALEYFGEFARLNGV